MGEFIVNLQIMRSNFDRLGFRVVTEIEGQARRARLTLQQECDRGGAGRLALQCFDDGSPQGRRTILIQQFEKLHGLPAG
jgi:hypothetical protein